MHGENLSDKELHILDKCIKNIAKSTISTVIMILTLIISNNYNLDIEAAKQN